MPLKIINFGGVKMELFLVTWKENGIQFKNEFESYTQADDFYLEKFCQSCDCDTPIHDVNLYQKLKSSKLINLY